MIFGQGIFFVIGQTACVLIIETQSSNIPYIEIYTISRFVIPNIEI